ncbi:hypothetical protein BD408DRAFT_420744 [Parasitella parasitica]|nr:hypothetical protein BD408DRAFT_420744 [Parasitella parasitica]
MAMIYNNRLAIELGLFQVNKNLPRIYLGLAQVIVSFLLYIIEHILGLFVAQSASALATPRSTITFQDEK